MKKEVCCKNCGEVIVNNKGKLMGSVLICPKCKKSSCVKCSLKGTIIPKNLREKAKKLKCAICRKKVAAPAGSFIGGYQCPYCEKYYCMPCAHKHSVSTKCNSCHKEKKLSFKCNKCGWDYCAECAKKLKNKCICKACEGGKLIPYKAPKIK